MTDPYEESLVNPNMKDEVLKLILIVRDDKGASFWTNYLLEKLERIYNGVPLAIHPHLQRKFNEIKGGKDAV